MVGFRKSEKRTVEVSRTNERCYHLAPFVGLQQQQSNRIISPRWIQLTPTGTAAPSLVTVWIYDAIALPGLSGSGTFYPLVGFAEGGSLLGFWGSFKYLILQQEHAFHDPPPVVA